MSARPEYHRESTENARFVKPSTEKCSRVLISTLRRRTQPRHVLGQEPVAERHPPLRLLPPRLAKPGIERPSQSVHQRTGRSGLDLDQIDILGIARGRRQVELVERRASPEGEPLGEHRIGEHLDQGAADNEVLLDLEALAPRRPRPPLGDVVSWDHESVSTLEFTNSRQSVERGAPSASALGSSFVKLRARWRTWSFSSTALSPAPTCSRR